MKTFCVEIKGLANADTPDAFKDVLAQNKSTLSDLTGFCDRNGVVNYLDTLSDGVAGLVFKGEDRLAQAVAKVVPQCKVVDQNGAVVSPAPTMSSKPVQAPKGPGLSS